ncbi:hypothetical protein LXL04_012524 [Taraxacum kok-saghyz]
MESHGIDHGKHTRNNSIVQEKKGSFSGNEDHIHFNSSGSNALPDVPIAKSQQFKNVSMSISKQLCLCHLSQQRSKGK